MKIASLCLLLALAATSSPPVHARTRGIKKIQKRRAAREGFTTPVSEETEVPTTVLEEVDVTEWTAADDTSNSSLAVEGDSVYGDSDKGKGSKSKSKSRKGGAVPSYCSDFCDTYLTACESANHLYDPKYPRGAGTRRLREGNPLQENLPRLPKGAGRHLIEGFEDDLKRFPYGIFSTQDDCESACAEYPTPYFGEEQGTFNNRIITGDTFWCRNNHVSLAEAADHSPDNQYHCLAASPSGAGICTNSYVSNNTATTWEFYRAGAETGRHIGYCQLYAGDTIADCTNAGITDANIANAFSMIPESVIDLILSDNPGITTLAADVFGGLPGAANIESLFIDSCENLKTIDNKAFDSLENLEVLSLNNNYNLEDLPGDLLFNQDNLKEFSMVADRGTNGVITATSSLPFNLFAFSPNIERILISGHIDLIEIPTGTLGTFLREKTKLRTLQLNDNGLTDLPADLFKDLESLEYLDLANNFFDELPLSWFKGADGTGSYCPNLRRLAMNDNDNLANPIDGDIFSHMPKLETVLLHNTKVAVVDVDLFLNNPELITFTIKPV